MAKKPRTIEKRPIPLYKVVLRNPWAKRRLLRYLRREDGLISQKELIRAGFTSARIRQMVKLGVVEMIPPRRLPLKKIPPIPAEPSATKTIEIPTADSNTVSEQSARSDIGKSEMDELSGAKKIKKGKEKKK